MHNSLSWSSSTHKLSWTQRSPSTSFQRSSASHRTDCMMEYMNTSMEEMDWSDSCLDASNNSLLSPAAVRVQSSRLSGGKKNAENTSPSSLLSSLNITDFSRHQDVIQPFASQKFKTTSTHLSAFQLSQSTSKFSLAKSKLPLVVPDLPSASPMLPLTKPNLPFATSKSCSLVPKSRTPLPTFHRTFQQSSYYAKKSQMLDRDVIRRRPVDRDMIVSALHDDESQGALGNKCVMKNEDESFLGNEIGEERDPKDGVLAEESDSPKTKSPNLKKPRRSICAWLFHVSSYVLLAVLVMIGATLLPSSYFRFPDCDTRINVSHVRQALSKNVFGQHLAVDVVTDSLGQFLDDDQRRLLVLSFQGWTGIGKNHMSNILARFVPPENVHRYIVTLHFAGNSKLDVENWIGSKVAASCGVHLFVIDEMDKASDVLVSRIRKALRSSREFIANYSHTKVVVLLLSNTASTTINAYTAQVLEAGVSRENIAYDGLRERLETVLRNVWYGEMLREKLIDRIVPFLPLEKPHVEKCTVAALGSRQVAVRDELLSAVINRLSFFPVSNSMFSTTGCRKVNAELDLLLY